jgi:hypothetical protein
MTARKIPTKIHNKKLRRRREGLSNKSYEYGELDGVELALFIRYPKRGDFYSYMSRKQLPWLQDVETMVRLALHMLSCVFLSSKQMKHPKAKNEFPEDVKKRAEETRRKLKKPNDEIIPTEEEDEDEASEQGGEALLEPVPTKAFPEFPFDLPTLRKQLESGLGVGNDSR